MPQVRNKLENSSNKPVSSGSFNDIYTVFTSSAINSKQISVFIDNFAKQVFVQRY
jgi:hypothetical protein